MLRYVVWRLLTLLPLLLFISALAFSLMHLVPGSIAVVLLDDRATPENVQALEAELGLDDPLPIQFTRWLGGVVRGDMGESLSGNFTVSEAIVQRLPVTLSITTGGIFLAVVIGVGSGILASLMPQTPVDRTITVFTSLGAAMPAYFMGFLLIVWFAIQNNWFPALGYTAFTDDPLGWLRSITLPILALGISSAAPISRQTRSAMLTVLQSHYIQAARAAGLPQASIIWRYALRNAMIPVLTVIGMRYSVMFGIAFVVEQVFALPGMGELLVRSVLNRDIPVVQGSVVVIGVIIALINTLVDISYGQLDPRARLK